MNEKNQSENAQITMPPKQELSPEELREKLKDPSYLPTHEDMLRAFKQKRSSYDNQLVWIHFCLDEQNPVFEFLNAEFLNALTDYLAQRIEELVGTTDNPTTILEVGAGNGRLTHFLQQKLEQRIPGKVKVIATDSGEWGLKTAFPVEQLDHKVAIEKYQPQIVICSWMPDKDFTAAFRSTNSVQEYILIGETDGGCCGDGWKTWGYSPLFETKTPLYERDGFEREDLDNISESQICRVDEPGRYHSSKTVSFRRKK